jgi:hypothetical protein
LTSPSIGYVNETGALLAQSEASPYEGGASRIEEVSLAEYAAAMMERQAVAAERLARGAYDNSHPVDEYISSDGVPNQTNTSEFGATFDVVLELTRNWDLPEKIESYIVTLPIGTVSAWLKLADRWITLYGNPVGLIPGPGLPASTVPVQNPYPYPVNATIIGGTVTAVFVNGIQVGAGDGTYIVPAAGSLSITYSVAPSLLWTGTATPLPAPLTITNNGLGFILNQDDDRLLLINGTLTSGPTHFEIMGHADEIYGNY